MIPRLLRYYITFYEQRFMFYKWAQFGAKWRQIGTSGAPREKCSESTPQKSMIPLPLRYYTTFYEQRLMFYKWAQFGATWRKMAPK